MYERAKHCALYVAVEPKSYYISGTCVAAVGRFSNFYSLHSDINRFLNQGCALGSRGRMDDNLCKLENKAIKKWRKYFSIKHDLARSCFQFWLKIGDEGDKISRKILEFFLEILKNLKISN